MPRVHHLTNRRRKKHEIQQRKKKCAMAKSMVFIHRQAYGITYKKKGARKSTTYFPNRRKRQIWSHVQICMCIHIVLVYRYVLEYRKGAESCCKLNSSIHAQFIPTHCKDIHHSAGTFATRYLLGILLQIWRIN